MKNENIKPYLSRERIADVIFFIVSIITFCLIAYKVFNIPITHDETATTVHYSKYSIWQIMMYPDPWPNNHILNTLLAKLFISFFGTEQWAVRMPNLFFFIIYCVGAYNVLKSFFSESDVLYIGAITLFFGNAYLFDFFGLSRGYGISSAMVLLSASFLISGYHKCRTKDIWISFISGLLASYASFTCLVYWVAIIPLCLFFFYGLRIRNFKYRMTNVSALSLICILYLALIFPPIRKMSSTGQFAYWQTEGFFRDTLYSLVENWQYNNIMPFGIGTHMLMIGLIIILFLAILLAIWRFYKEGFQTVSLKSPLILSATLLVFTILVSVTQSEILGTPHLTGRTALFFYPLISLVLVGMISEMQPYFSARLKTILAISIFSFSFWHMSNSYNPKNVREWWYDESTFDVLTFIQNNKSELNEMVSLDVNWHFHRSFFFYTDTGKLPWLTLYDYDKDIDPASCAHYYYVFESDLELFDTSFVKVQKFGWDRWLLRSTYYN